MTTRNQLDVLYQNLDNLKFVLSKTKDKLIELSTYKKNENGALVTFTTKGSLLMVVDFYKESIYVNATVEGKDGMYELCGTELGAIYAMYLLKVIEEKICSKGGVYKERDFLYQGKKTTLTQFALRKNAKISAAPLKYLFSTISDGSIVTKGSDLTR